MESDKQDEQISADNDQSSSAAANNLRDECLIEIFSLLSFVDRVRIQRVCKRWHELSRRSWHRYNTLSLDQEDWGNPSKAPLDLSVLKNLLDFGGRYVKRVEFFRVGRSDYNLFNVDENFFKVIVERCPNVATVTVYEVSKTSECIKYLSHMPMDLTEFCLARCEEINSLDLSLKRLFRRNKKLRVLYLHENKLKGGCLLQVNREAIEEINVTGDCGPPHILSTALKWYTNLKKFTISNESLSDFLTHINEFLEGIAYHAESFKHLEIEGGCTVQAKSVRCFRSLEKLVLRRVIVNPKFFEDVGKNCTNIKHLQLTDVRTVSRVGMRSIVQLPKLQVLHLYFMSSVTDNIFKEGLSFLKEFYCSYCSGIGTNAVCKFLRTSKYLECLEITNCKNVSSSDLINVAKEVAIGRVHGPALKLIVTSSVSERTVTRVSRNLEIIEQSMDQWIKQLFARGRA